MASIRCAAQHDNNVCKPPRWSLHVKNTFIDIDDSQDDDSVGLRREQSEPVSPVARRMPLVEMSADEAEANDPPYAHSGVEPDDCTGTHVQFHDEDLRIQRMPRSGTPRCNAPLADLAPRGRKQSCGGCDRNRRIARNSSSSSSRGRGWRRARTWLRRRRGEDSRRGSRQSTTSSEPASRRSSKQSSVGDPHLRSRPRNVTRCPYTGPSSACMNRQITPSSCEAVSKRGHIAGRRKHWPRQRSGTGRRWQWSWSKQRIVHSSKSRTKTSESTSRRNSEQRQMTHQLISITCPSLDNGLEQNQGNGGPESSSPGPDSQCFEEAATGSVAQQSAECASGKSQAKAHLRGSNDIKIENRFAALSVDPQDFVFPEDSDVGQPVLSEREDEHEVFAYNAEVPQLPLAHTCQKANRGYKKRSNQKLRTRRKVDDTGGLDIVVTKQIVAPDLVHNGIGEHSKAQKFVSQTPSVIPHELDEEPVTEVSHEESGCCIRAQACCEAEAKTYFPNSQEDCMSSRPCQDGGHDSTELASDLRHRASTNLQPMHSENGPLNATCVSDVDEGTIEIECAPSAHMESSVTAAVEPSHDSPSPMAVPDHGEDESAQLLQEHKGEASKARGKKKKKKVGSDTANLNDLSKPCNDTDKADIHHSADIPVPVRRHGQAQGFVLAQLAVRLQERAVARYLLGAAAHRAALAVPVDEQCISAPRCADILPLDLSYVVMCEASDSYGWACGTLIAPQSVAGQRGCFRMDDVRLLVAQLRVVRGGDDVLDLVEGRWEELKDLQRESTQSRLRDKALVNRMRVARAAWEKLATSL